MRGKIALAASTVLVVALTVAFPARMIQPGSLAPGHRQLDRPCLGCHAPLRGPQAESCLRCHKLEEIGVRTVAGMAIPLAQPPKPPFHPRLASTECFACHTLHATLRLRQATPFRHELLAAADRADCGACHGPQKPQDALHASVRIACAACHTTRGWRPAAFDHSQAGPAAPCASCHLKDHPNDGLHQASSASCAACHGTARWRPANFDHARYFRFDRNHPADCRTCHTDPKSHSTYTCYGCHEHTPARIEAEHREEGIRDFRDCARCHRSGDEDSAERGGEGRGRRGERGRDGGEREQGEDDD